ncbi:MAG: hypothetical protein GW779_07210 [Candidatus Altiarchaeum hamiconexum]|uniref:DUF1640 domain-containing protein n=1 Tax=Candidatus Altarchaeum hamiconexum TaxID=1803513 RepID=A0A8J7YW30_9ARCH|nr:hypothetical protein [Candidatus Altarchaeum hamiconexum]OIQ06248.1 MAG: hypothetical protein AUK59_00550 [Candidatus Altarchaeum sp. CG2_30_32_3053]PIV27423.1 MAG: hypothetical protein COS36_05775 [Candidatus Altarchaeum sp. CG03_land_8_20_14_0_80_32_618]PJC13862.1 MAG: hypothetical protein CO063_03500 [Candidatus Altarchaeum sp. CG_4_9_14_0_8_um_filter_32_206]NCN69512.1 hypothetical protein [Candidatus Altarchaeum hamiconexum]
MSDAFITADQYNEILARLGKLEHKEQYVGKHEDVYKDVEELKGKYYNIDKRTEVTDTKIDAFRVELKQEIGVLRIAVDNRLGMMWNLLLIILVAILGIFGTLIIILFKLFGGI